MQMAVIGWTKGSSVVIGIHQGVDGYIQHQKESKAIRKDIHWNNLQLGWNGNITEYRRIIREGSLRYCNRIVRTSISKS